MLRCRNRSFTETGRLPGMSPTIQDGDHQHHWDVDQDEAYLHFVCVLKGMPDPEALLQAVRAQPCCSNLRIAEYPSVLLVCTAFLSSLNVLEQLCTLLTARCVTDI